MRDGLQKWAWAMAAVAVSSVSAQSVRPAMEMHPIETTPMPTVMSGRPTQVMHAEQAGSPIAEFLGEHEHEPIHVSKADHSSSVHLSEAGAEEFSPGWIVTGDLLYMQPRRNGMDFAIRDRANDLRPIGIVENLEWETQMGYRVGLGGRYCSGWQWDVLYTGFEVNSARALSAPAGGVLYATAVTPGSLVSEVQTASLSSQLDYDVVDVEMGKWRHLDESLRFRWFSGARIASIRQESVARYAGITTTGVDVRRPDSFEGVGLRFGSEARSALNHHWSVVGRAAVSMMVGESKSSLIERTPLPGPVGIPQVTTSITESEQRAVPVIDLMLGLHWTNGRASLLVGYELTHWFDVAQTLDFVDDVHLGKIERRPSDLALEGLVARLGWNY